jgi:broad specificity phosphatase PhoE
MKRTMTLVGWILFLATSSTAFAVAEPTASADPEALGPALQHGGYIIFLRHAMEDGVDQSPIDVDDCATQQYLTDEGVAQALAIGEQFRTLDIPVGRVVSSQYCRAYDTAVLAFGDAELLDFLTPPAGLSPAAQEAQPAALLDFLATPPEPGTNTVVASHAAVLVATVGVTMERAEAAIFAPDGAGGFDFVTILAWDEWSALAALD